MGVGRVGKGERKGSREMWWTISVYAGIYELGNLIWEQGLGSAIVGGERW